MVRTCWCGNSNTDYIHGCAPCSLVARGFTGLPNSDIPRDTQLESMNNFLKEGRGLSDEQRFQLLVDLLSCDSDLPRPFRTKRGPPRHWDEKHSEAWRSYLRLVDIHGSVFTEHLPLPGGGLLSVDVEGDISIDGLKLPGPLPLRDIAHWLSNPARINRISDWPQFLIAMSCCMRKFSNHFVDDVAHWFRVNSWHGIDHRLLEEMQNFSFTYLQHPFLKFVHLSEKHKGGGNSPKRELLDANKQIIRELGGVAASAWQPLIENQQEMIRSIITVGIIPKLVVVNGRFCLMVMRDGKVMPLPVPVDTRIWRLLISWVLEPHAGLGQDRLNLLFWCWSSEQETWTLPSNQKKSILFLREAVESLGEYCSLEPVKGSPDVSGLRVDGRSGMHYLLLPTMDPRKFSVRAVPYESMIPNILDNGLSLCIDSQANVDIPSGDVALSYLMSLHNDVDSKLHVHTLGHMFELVNKTRHWKKKSNQPLTWWDEVIKNYSSEDPEHYEELEDEWGDDYEQDEEFHEEDWPDEENLTQEEIEFDRQVATENIAADIQELDEQHLETRQRLEELFIRFGGDPDALEGEA